MKSRFRFLILPAILTALTFVSSAQPGNADIIKNSIKINTDGLTVTKAKLRDEDGIELKQNQTTLNKPIYLRLEVTGWLTNNGKVKLGASEKIATNKGTLILYVDDFFPGKEEYKPEDAKYISLKAVITSTQRDIKFFNVKFRVWDKNNGNSITGSYMFTIKN